MTVGERHAWVIRTLTDCNDRLKRLGCHMQVQLPLSLPPFDAPEPDGAIIRGKKDEYKSRHPTAADVLCVIEVADSSLVRDRTRKLKIYAAAGLPRYLIINLRDDSIEVYSQPEKENHRFGQVVTLSRSDKLTLPLYRGKGVTLRVSEFIP